MTASTITLEIRRFRVTPPAHAGRSPCLCDQCWQDYLDSFAPHHEPPGQ